MRSLFAQYPWAPFALSFTTVGLFTAWTHVRLRRRLQELAEIMDDRPGEIRGWFDMVLSAHFHSREATVALDPGGRNRPSRLTLTLACRSEMDFLISRPNVLQQLGRTLHLTQELGTESPELGDNFTTESEDGDEFKRWMGNEEDARNALRSLTKDRGVDRLTNGMGGLQATLVNYSGDEASTENVRAIFTDLSTLARTLEAA